MSSEQSAAMQCFLRFKVYLQHYSHSTDTEIEQQSCLINPRSGMAFAIPFPQTLFNYKSNVTITSAIVTFAPVEIALPAKYSLLAAPGLATFNDPDLSDCSILAKDAKDPIHVSRAILARGSPFFVTMFKGTWSEFIKSDTPVTFGWSASALLPCLIHIYSGWVIGDPLPDDSKRTNGKMKQETAPSAAEVDASAALADPVPKSLAAVLCVKYAVDVQSFTVHQLLELTDLARLLELPSMVAGANREMVRVLNAEMDMVSAEVDVMRRQEMVDLANCLW